MSFGCDKRRISRLNSLYGIAAKPYRDDDIIVLSASISVILLHCSSSSEKAPNFSVNATSKIFEESLNLRRVS